MKRTCLFTALIILILAPILGRSAVYIVKAASDPENGSFYASTEASDVGSVLIEAHELIEQYRTRPYWHLGAFRKGEDVPAALAPDVIAHLIPCESLDRNISVIDSNNQWSRGPLMFQDATWAEFSVQSGIHGNSTDTTDAVNMALWAVENGYLNRWSCARILGIIATSSTP